MTSEPISVVVPVFNSADTLAELVDRLEIVLSTQTTAFEVILVDDGSVDDSWTVIANIARDRDWVVPLKLTRNFGQHNALLCGIRRARFPVTATLDDDLQHPPEELPRLLAALDHFDVVYGAPSLSQHGLVRSLASKMTKIALSGAMGAKNARNSSAFRVFRTSLRRAFDRFDAPYVSIDVLLTWATTKFTYVEVNHRARSVGVTNYTIRGLITHALNMLTGFSVLPLQVASVVGLAATVFGGGLLAFLLIRWVAGGSTVPGFTFVASSVVLFGGIQLFALGVIGEYLARIHVRSMGRPSYVEDETSTAVRESITNPIDLAEPK